MSLIICFQVATKPSGKIYLSQQHDELTPFLEYLQTCLHSGAQEDKMCVLDTSASLLYLKVVFIYMLLFF